MLPPEDDRAHARQRATRAAGQGDAAVRNLGFARLAAQLPGGFGEQEDAAHTGMARRQAAAVGVERHPAAAPQVALLDERAALALSARAR